MKKLWNNIMEVTALTVTPCPTLNPKDYIV